MRSGSQLSSLRATVEFVSGEHTNTDILCLLSFEELEEAGKWNLNRWISVSATWRAVTGRISQTNSQAELPHESVYEV
jgi:hypothetical protein